MELGNHDSMKKFEDRLRKEDGRKGDVLKQFNKRGGES